MATRTPRLGLFVSGGGRDDTQKGREREDVVRGSPFLVLKIHSVWVFFCPKGYKPKTGPFTHPSHTGNPPARSGVDTSSSWTLGLPGHRRWDGSLSRGVSPVESRTTASPPGSPRTGRGYPPVSGVPNDVAPDPAPLSVYRTSGVST